MGSAFARAALVVVPALMIAGCSGVSGTAVAAPTPTSRPGLLDMFDAVKIFDEDKVAAGVTQVLTDDPPSGYGLTGVEDVECPARQRVTAGTSFECELELDGEHTTVTIVVQNDDGLYEVNPPNRPT